MVSTMNPYRGRSISQTTYRMDEEDNQRNERNWTNIRSKIEQWVNTEEIDYNVVAGEGESFQGVLFRNVSTNDIQN